MPKPRSTYLEVVRVVPEGLAQHHLWRHPVRSAYKRVMLLQRRLVLRRHAEIRCNKITYYNEPRNNQGSAWIGRHNISDTPLHSQVCLFWTLSPSLSHFIDTTHLSLILSTLLYLFRTLIQYFDQWLSHTIDTTPISFANYTLLTCTLHLSLSPTTSISLAHYRQYIQLSHTL